MEIIVNGRPISEDAFDAEFGSIKSYFENLGNVSCCERDDEFRGYAKQNLVAKALLAEEADRRTAAPAESDIDAVIEDMKREQGEFQFAAMAATAPGQLEGIREEIASNIRTQRMLQEVWKDLPEPTEDELRKYYDDNIAVFMSPEQLRASHISKNPGHGENRAGVYEKLREVRKQLLAGASFDDLAREHSDKGKEQIDLGFFKRGELPEEFELVTFSMEVGELSPIFASTYGFHIAKVTDRLAPSPKPFEESRDTARQILIEERRKAKTQSLVDELKLTAKIEERTVEFQSSAAE
jgi:parvulin-like peptidyl-prolyl isomerase